MTHTKAIMLSARPVASEHLRDVGERMYRTLAKVHIEEEEEEGGWWICNGFFLLLPFSSYLLCVQWHFGSIRYPLACLSTIETDR